MVAGEGGGDLVGEAVGPAVPAGAGEGDQLLAGGRRQQVAGRPLLQQLQHGGAAQVIAGDGQGGREGRQQILAEPVEQPPLIAGGALVVAGDGAQLSGQLPVGDQGRSPAWRSRASRQAMRASSASSFFLAGPRRRATRSGLTGRTT